MTKPLTFTQASICRAVAAARKAGLRVVEIKPDGSLVVEESGATLVPGDLTDHNAAAPADPWGDVQA